MLHKQVILPSEIFFFSLLVMHIRREIRLLQMRKIRHRSIWATIFGVFLLCFALSLYSLFSVCLLNPPPALLCLLTLGLVLGTSQPALTFPLSCLPRLQSKSILGRQQRDERKHRILCLCIQCPVSLLGAAGAHPSQSEHLQMQ